ncbi:MAG: LysR family transcriptional regulator [Woeseiaceae bacterium]|nr:LysR family transcriptional regulator [Woeseiaceae bacterium]
MRLRQIEVFHAVYSSGSMTNAAALLNVSQPSVSKVLAHAEQQLGYRLFDRVKGKLIPTPEAHQLYKHVREVYDDVDRLRHVAANLKATSAGRIRVAGTPAFGLEVLPRAISTFRDEHPDAIFEVETLHHDEIYGALHESRIDIGLAFDAPEQPGIRRKKIARGDFLVLAPDRRTFGRKPSLSVNDIKDRPFIGLNSRGPLGKALSDYLEAAGVEPNIVAWTETYHIAKALAASGAGVTIADEITARSITGGDVVMYPLKPPVRFDITMLQLAETPLSLAAKRFTRHLGRLIKELLND